MKVEAENGGFLLFYWDIGRYNFEGIFGAEIKDYEEYMVKEDSDVGFGDVYVADGSRRSFGGAIQEG